MAIAGIPNPGVCAYPPGTARRRFARRAVDAEGIGANLGEEARADVVNLSEGGLQIRSSKPLVLASGELVSLSLPGGTAIRANCELVWSDASGAAGLRFLAFSDNSKTKLAKWLSGRIAEAPAPVERPPIAPATAPQDLQPNLTPVAGPRWGTEADEIGLEELIRRMMVMTAAEGAAIALRREDAIVCRATAGHAPGLGVKLNPEAGLSGRCLRSGEPVLCRDSETDPTVNAEACRALRLRAALLVPVKREGRVQGVLEVFSSKPDVFDIADVAALQRVSEMVAEYLPKERAAAVEAPATEVAAPETPTGRAGIRAEPAAVTTRAEDVTQETPAEITPSLMADWPKAVLRLVEDPHYKPWKRVVYWSAVAVRSTLSLATWTVPLSYLVYFLVGPVIRPGAVQNTAVFGYITAVVEPGMALADYFFSFRAVIHGWNLMFLVVAGMTLVGRAIALKPINFLLKKAEDLTRPKKRYAYVPYLPHRTEFR